MRLFRLTFALSFLAAGAAGHAADANLDSTVQRATHVCAACHNPSKARTKDAVPSIAGQMPQYIAAQLKDFRSQTRSEGDVQAYMWGISALLDDATIDGLAAFFASQTPDPGRAGDPKLIESGRKIYEQGLSERGVRACAGCHGANAEGASVFPRLAGLNAEYLFRQLRVFGTRLRPHGVLMKNEVANMSEREMHAVAEFLQSK